MADKLVDLFLRRRHYFALAVIALTILFSHAAPSVEVDNTLRGTSVSDSPAYTYYRNFMEEFGDDEFLLIVLFNKTAIHNVTVLKCLANITHQLEKLEKIDSVVSLANLRSLEKKEQGVKFSAVMTGPDSQPGLPPAHELKELLASMPKTDLLLSEDLKATGVLVRIEEQSRFDSKIGDLIRTIRRIVETNLPPGSTYGLAGFPVVRDAFLRYNLRTAILLSLLSTFIGWLVSIYVYKSLKFSLIPLLISCLSLIWVAGLMSLLGIRISTATAMAFGLVVVITTTTVVHIIGQYARHFRRVQDRGAAVRLALLTVIAPALMCTLTTSAGFASIAVSDLPMIQQLGMIMSMSVFITYVLALIVCPYLLLLMEPPSRYGEQGADLITGLIQPSLGLIEAHPRLVFLACLALQLVMAISIPNIHREARLTSLFKDTVPEIQDIRLIERNLAPINSLELVLEADSGTFARADVLSAVQGLEESLLQVPGVVRGDSILPWIRHLSSVLAEGKESSREAFPKPAILREYLAVTRLNPHGKRMIASFVNNDLSKLRVSVRITNSPSTVLSEQIHAVRSAATEALGGKARIRVTGQLVTREDIGGRLVRLQVLSLAMAISLITALLVIEFRSIAVGLLSLIPNVMPVLAVFGTMGWFGIPLDSVTVFAAAFSIGLAVDSTIHYLTHLRRAVFAGNAVEMAVRISFESTSRPIIAGTVILVLGFAGLTLSPFKSITAGGVLCSISMLAAMIGDLMFMPAVILTFPFVRRHLAK